MSIKTIDELRRLYGYASGRAKIKELKKLDKHSIRFIETSPFLVISTVNNVGKMDTSPRGGNSGFIKIIDDKTLYIPDAKGNNRLDSLSNIIQTGQVGLLFFIPGMDETLRVNGSAFISVDEDKLNLFSNLKNQPKSIISVTIEEVFLHCAKAFMRSELWDKDAQITRSDFPTMGQMLNDQLNLNDPIESELEMRKRYKKDL